ncbi:MAG: hypothetical protein ACRDUY_09865 [Nitriliruptorales bacterium]
MSTDLGYLPELDSRDDYVDWLEGYGLPVVEELQEGRSTRKLVKTYMLETVGSTTAMPDLEAIVPDRIRLARVDDSLYRVHDAEHAGGIVGLIETIDDRHPVFYTTLGSTDSEKWVHQVLDRSPWLDRLWLSSPILFELWQYVQRTTPSHRYVRLGFEHEAWYEAADEGEEGSETDSDDDAASVRVEHRRSRVHLTERLAVLEEKLPELTALYDPLHSLVQVQVPSGGRGGHLLYYDGKATNRSESFAEHRGTVELVLKLYRAVTERAEERLWIHTDTAEDEGFTVEGAPILIEFGTPLSQATFDRFVELGLQRRTSKFRLGGFVKRRGPTKVHLTGIDRHLLQPFLMEATSRHLLAVLPRGTCGNSIHRLVTNVQRLLDPDVRVWLGDEPYEQAVAASMGRAA